MAKKSLYHNKAGFTLIEVLISLAIFTIIGLATVKQISQIVNTKNIAFSDLDLYNEVRAALSVIRNDLSQAFHILFEELGENNDSRILLQQNQAVFHTLFDGRKDQLIFTSLSHRVYYAGRKEVSQTEISYFLKKKEKAELPSLFKRESEFIDSDLYQGGKIYTVLDQVASLEFEFWDEKQEKWISDWNSDGAQLDKFPYAVKIKIEVKKPGMSGPSLKVETAWKLAFPNNESVLVQLQ